MLSVELFDLYRLDRLGCGIEPIRVDESELRSRPLVARLELCRPCWLSGFDVCDRGLHLCLVVRPRAECCGLTALARVLDFDQCERWLALDCLAGVGRFGGHSCLVGLDECEGGVMLRVRGRLGKLATLGNLGKKRGGEIFPADRFRLLPPVLLL